MAPPVEGPIRQPRRNPTLAGRSRPGAGRHRHCRPRLTGAKYLALRMAPAGKQAASRSLGPVPGSDQVLDCVVARFLSGLLSRSMVPSSIAWASARMASMAAAEPVELGLHFRFRRLDHQRACHRPAHRRRMETAIGGINPLGDVGRRDAGACDQRGLCRECTHAPPGPWPRNRARHRRPSAARRYSWRLRNRDLRRLCQAFAAHHQAIGPGDRQDRGRAERAPPRNRAGLAVGLGVPRKIGGQMRLTPIGPMPGPPPPCGMQKVLCRLRWLTSEPMSPGRASPTSALRLAPSR